VAGVKIHAIEEEADLSQVCLPLGFLYGLDCETNGRDPFAEGFDIRLIQIGTEHAAYVFRMDQPWQRDYVTDLLADLDTSFTSYTDYDTMSVWRALGVDISHRNVDCRILATMASPDDKLGGVDLKTVTEKYLKVKWLTTAQKDLNEEFVRLYKESHPEATRLVNSEVAAWGWANVPMDNPVYLRYAGLDAVAARRLVPVLISKSGAPFSLIKMETWLDAEAARMRMRGMDVDQAAYDLLYNEKKAACNYHEEEFGKIVFEQIRRGRKPNYVYIDKPISPRSGKKVAAYLHSKGADFTGFPLTDKGLELLDNGQLTAEDEVAGTYASMGKKNKELVERLNLDPEAEQAVEHLFGFKESQYTVTKLEEIAKVIDNRNVVHPVLRTCGTVTGRMSSSGPNTQNYSKKDPAMREIFVPPPGYVLIGCDFAQIEIRVGAALSQCPVLQEILETGADIHQATADATGTDRQTAKITNFLCQYNGGPKALNAQTGIPYDRAKEIVAAYWKLYWGMDKYRKHTGRFQPEIRTIANRRIPVPYNWEKREYMSYKNINYFIQSAAREMICASWWRFRNNPGTEDMHMWAIIHDEMIVAVPVDKVEFGMRALANSMTFDLMGVEVKADAVILADRTGRLCWTTGDKAAEYAEYRAQHNIPLEFV
jgi:DNA polymerase-1